MIYEHYQYLELPMTSSYTPSALEIDVRCDRVGKQVSACPRMGARARVGLSPGGREAGRACGRGACLRKGQLLGLDFWKKWQFVIISRKL
jgi:hypothetical protein